MSGKAAWVGWIAAGGAVLVGGRGAVAAAEVSRTEALFALEAAEINLVAAEEELERARQLSAAGLVAAADLSRAKKAADSAFLQRDQAIARLLTAGTDLIIEEAAKYVGTNGERRVRLRFKPVGFELRPAGGEAAASARRSLRSPGSLRVAIKTIPGYREGVLMVPVTISRPYEVYVPEIQLGRSLQLDFGLLLPDVNEVLIEFGIGERTIEKRVVLGADRMGEGITIAAREVSIAAALGGDAEFVLVLERFGSEARRFGLGLREVPEGVRYEFVDQKTSARLSDVFFPDGTAVREILLRLSLPARPGPGIEIGKPIAFAVTVGDADIPAGVRRADTAGDAGSELAGLDLELIPYGRERLEVRVDNLFRQIGPGEELVINTLVENMGSADALELLPKVETPFGWQARVTPAKIELLEPGRTAEVQVSVTPPESQSEGEYECRVMLAAANSKTGEEGVKVLRVRVEKAQGRAVLSLLVLSFLGIVAGSVGLFARLSRR